MLAIHSWQTPALDWLMKSITLAGSYGAGLVMIIAVAWLGRRGDRPTAMALVASVIGAVAISGLLKLVFARPRPTVFPPLTVEHTYSFPSGHSIIAVALYGFLATLLWQKRRYGWALFSAIMIPLIAFSRVYLGVHYPSDVLAALMLGLLWLMLVMTALAWHRHLTTS